MPPYESNATGSGDAAQSPTLSRQLSGRTIQLIAIGGAIGTGLFMGSGKTISLAGPSVLLVYGIIGFMLFFVMRAMGELLLSNLKYKSFCDFAGDLLGPAAGFFAGWTYWFCWVVTVTAEIIAIAGYLQLWWPNLPLWVAPVGVVLLLLCLNLPTVKAFGEAEFWFAIIKVVAILALIVVGLIMVLRAFRSPDGEVASFANLWNHGGFFPTGMTGFLAGFQIALFAFVGIEVVGTTAAESRDPNKELPHAINTVPIRILLFYIGALAVIMMVTPWNTVSPDKSPFVAMFTLAGLGIAATVVNLVVITSAASSANSGLYSSARMVFGLSQEGNAPQHFNKLSRRGVPLRATCFTAVFLFASLALLYMGGSVMEAFTVVTTIGAFLFMVVWSLILASYIAFRRKYPERHEASKFKLPGGTAVCYMVFAFFIFGLFTLCLAADTRQALMFAPLFLIGLGIAWLFVRKSPKHQAKFQEFKQHIAR